MNQKQIALPSSKASMQKRMPKGKRIHSIASNSGVRNVSRSEIENTYRDAKLSESQVNLLQRNLTLGLALLGRAKVHAAMAASKTSDSTMISSLTVAIELIEKAEKLWPVKVV